MNSKVKYTALIAAGVSGVAVLSTLYPNTAAFCKRAVECGSVANYDACVSCANPTREQIVATLLDAHGGIKRSMSDVACVTILWTAANYQITTCSDKGVNK